MFYAHNLKCFVSFLCGLIVLTFFANVSFCKQHYKVFTSLNNSIQINQ